MSASQWITMIALVLALTFGAMAIVTAVRARRTWRQAAETWRVAADRWEESATSWRKVAEIRANLPHDRTDRQ